ncbi:MAG: 3' terminal RNA ribose 2'-O-methyltransferase Hen1 [Actinomycetota bacterium]
MLLTITSTMQPATDLGFLLHKNPQNVRSVDLSYGRAHVVYPEASEERCTAALILEVDPIGLVRRGRGRQAFALADYVNDRPYVASSFMSVAIAKLFGTALSGRSEDRPELAEASIPLEAHLPVVPCRGGEELARRLFEPLGYEVTAATIRLDEHFPDWGDSRYLDLRISGTTRVRDLLRHLYVLLPVMDDDKHYWVERGEIEKLLAKGGEWLGPHPERDLIARRYLRHRFPLTREALARLSDEVDDPDAEEASHDAEEAAIERPMSLAEQRIGSVISALRAAGAKSVVDLGCGGGKLLQALMKDGAFEKIAGVDVSVRALEAAARRLHLPTMSPRQRERIVLFQSALTYRDRRVGGFDAAVLMEVIEHLEVDRLPALERALFDDAKPGTVVVTTPNVEYNVRFEGLPEGTPRHRDHRFEWTRAEFEAWATSVAGDHSYDVRFLPVGPLDPDVGSPTQMAVFTR